MSGSTHRFHTETPIDELRGACILGHLGNDCSSEPDGAAAADWPGAAANGSFAHFPLQTGLAGIGQVQA